MGEIPDLAINPQARVFERQHDDTRKVSLLVSLANAAEFEGRFEIDLEGIVYNEGLTRSLGSAASNTAVFSISGAPTQDIPVQRGYPIGTLPDEGTGSTVAFVTTEARTMLASAASSYFNIATGRYELSVPIIAVISGAAGQVGANRITRPLRPLVGFESVTNPTASAGGRDRESNQKLIDRNLIAIIGRRLATSTGIEKVVTDDFSDVDDVLIVSGTNPLLTRAGDTAGAVDAYIIGTEKLQQTEFPQFLGGGQLIRLASPPIIDVLSVQDLAAGVDYVEGVGYDVVRDMTGLARSQRAVEGIRFRFVSGLPVVGAPITITYSYNNLIRRLQAELEQDTTLVFGRDLLFKMGIEVPIVLNAGLRVAAGFNTSLVLKAVRATLLDFGKKLLLDDDVEGSDIQGVVRQISGVDNFKLTRLTRTTVPTGVEDILIAPNEYSTLADGDLTITFI